MKAYFSLEVTFSICKYVLLMRGGRICGIMKGRIFCHEAIEGCPNIMRRMILTMNSNYQLKLLSKLIY